MVQVEGAVPSPLSLHLPLLFHPSFLSSSRTTLVVCIASSTTGFRAYTSTQWHLDKSQMTLTPLDPKAILCIFYWTPCCWFLCPPSNPSLHGSCDPGLSWSPTYTLCHSLPSLPFVTHSLFLSFLFPFLLSTLYVSFSCWVLSSFSSVLCVRSLGDLSHCRDSSPTALGPRYPPWL